MIGMYNCRIELVARDCCVHDNNIMLTYFSLIAMHLFHVLEKPSTIKLSGCTGVTVTIPGANLLMGYHQPLLKVVLVLLINTTLSVSTFLLYVTLSKKKWILFLAYLQMTIFLVNKLIYDCASLSI